MPIATAIGEFLAHKRKQDSSRSLCEGGPIVWPHSPRAAIAELKPADALALYNAGVESVAVATHRARLRFARGFFAWAIDRGYVTRNLRRSQADLKPRRGKLQPRVDETRKLYAELFRLAWAGNPRPAVCLFKSCRARGLAGLGLARPRCRRRCHAAACCRRRRQDSKRDAHPRDRCPRPARPFCNTSDRKATRRLSFSRTCADGSTNSALYKYLRRLCARLNIPASVRTHCEVFTQR